MLQHDNTADRFARDTKTHRLEIAQEDGLYRHLKLRAHDKDGQPRGIGWFDLITSPGTLTFVGDYDAVVFRRLPDMFEFFRGSAHKGEPNFDYWAEKVASGGARSVEEYDEETFRQVVREHVAEDIRADQAPRGIGRALRPLFDPNSWEYDLTFEEGARDALDTFEYEGYRFYDTWEWSFKDYSHDFKWACHAIVLGIRLYDEAKAAVPAALPLSPGEAARSMRERALNAIQPRWDLQPEAQAVAAEAIRALPLLPGTAG